MAEKQKLVQQIVRSFPEVVWEPGFSKCYKDASYTKTKRKVRYKFDRIEVNGTFTNGYQDENLEARIKAALEAEGHVIDMISVYKDTILIWQEFPITIIEE